MTKLEPYPEYKDSGVEWLGEIPATWEVKPLLGIANETKRRNSDLKELNLLSLSYGRIVKKDIQTSEGLLPESFESYQIVEPNDIVFRLTDLQNDKRSLRSALVDERGIITSAYLAVRPHSINSRFFSYAMRDTDMRKVFYSMGGGLRQSMNFSDMKRLAVVVPSVSEQSAIVAFLDRETAEIDAFIADQEELIELLTERRAATISQAVTQGLDPSVPMKESGIEWLFDAVPVHWSKSRLGSLIYETKNVVGNKWDAHLLLSLTVRGIIPRDMVNVMGKLPADFTTYQEVHNNNLVFCLFDVEETPRTVGYATQSGMITGAYTVCQMRPQVAVLPEFLYYAYLSYDQHKLLRPLYAGLRNTIRKQDFKSVPVILPPLEEQQLIVQHVKENLSRIDETIADARKAIALSRERRAALISAAVTGKIDVCEMGAVT